MMLDPDSPPVADILARSKAAFKTRLPTQVSTQQAHLNWGLFSIRNMADSPLLCLREWMLKGGFKLVMSFLLNFA
jgi:hypothetical protein